MQSHHTIRSNGHSGEILFSPLQGLWGYSYWKLSFGNMLWTVELYTLNHPHFWVNLYTTLTIWDSLKWILATEILQTKLLCWKNAVHCKIDRNSYHQNLILRSEKLVQTDLKFALNKVRCIWYFNTRYPQDWCDTRPVAGLNNVTATLCPCMHSIMIQSVSSWWACIQVSLEQFKPGTINLLFYAIIVVSARKHLQLGKISYTLIALAGIYLIGLMH